MWVRVVGPEVGVESENGDELGDKRQYQPHLLTLWWRRGGGSTRERSRVKRYFFWRGLPLVGDLRSNFIFLVDWGWPSLHLCFCPYSLSLWLRL